MWERGWEDVYDATHYGAPCHQTTGKWDVDPSEHPHPSAPPPSEDCLFLNVYRPSAVHAPANASESGRLPVMVWIHGGGLCTGSGSSSWNHAGSLSHSGNVIVVVLNYRLGPLGFLAHPELAARYGGTGGMNGMRDQITALRWIQEHVGSFGGDRRRVTIMGESSGGVSTCVLTTSPMAKGLFRRSIVQSGACVVPNQGWGPHTAEVGYALGRGLARAVGAHTLAQLRALPPQRLQWSNATLNSDNFAGYSLDGLVLPRFPGEYFASGEVNAADGLVIGTTSKDGTAAFYSTAPLANATVIEWVAHMRRRFGNAAAAVMRHYPLSRFGNRSYPAASASYIEADADQRLVCPSRTIAELLTRAGVRSVYTYVFAHMQANCDDGFALDVLDRSAREHARLAGWASHGADEPYVFNTTHGPTNLAPPLDGDRLSLKKCPMNQHERELAAFMGGRWTAFAWGTAPWSAHARACDEAEADGARCAAGRRGTHTLRLETADEGGVTTLNEWKREDCDFWAGLGATATSSDGLPTSDGALVTAVTALAPVDVPWRPGPTVPAPSMQSAAGDSLIGISPARPSFTVVVVGSVSVGVLALGGMARRFLRSTHRLPRESPPPELKATLLATTTTA